MSIAAPSTVTFKPKARTEYEVAADVVVALLDGAFIKRDPETLARIALHLDVPVHILREAWRRRTDGKTFPLTGRPVVGAAPPEPLPVGEPEDPEVIARRLRKQKERAGKRQQTVTPIQRANLTDHVAARKEAKEPVEGMRICSSPCHEGERLINKTEFSVKDKAKGTLRAWCKPCMRVYVKSRYLTSQKIERLGDALRFVLGEGDEHVGRICPDCDQACEVGQEVVAPTSELHHAHCIGVVEQ